MAATTPASDEDTRPSKIRRTDSPTTTQHHLDVSEAIQYDRQIRLWGLAAQQSIRGARVLVAGLRGLGVEISKNIILAGIKSVCLHDDCAIAPEDLPGGFALPASIGLNVSVVGVLFCVRTLLAPLEVQG